MVASTAEDIVDVTQEFFEAGACDGFSLSIDSLHDGVDASDDEVVVGGAAGADPLTRAGRGRPRSRRPAPRSGSAGPAR